MTIGSRAIVRISDGTKSPADDMLALEEPVEFRLGDVPIAVVMRTPGADEELARGFALTEGIVLRPDELAEVRLIRGGSDGARYEMVLAGGVTVDPEQFRRNMYATSSCGVCGKASIDAVRVAARPLPAGPRMPAAALGEVADRMRKAQAGFDASGGLHAAAAFDGSGTLLAVREDIGRHNAVDKVVGALAHQRWPLGETGVMVSGRVSFEMVQKAAVAGFSIVAGVSAASSLAVDLGKELGVTVVGFVREGGCNVYAGFERII